MGTFRGDSWGAPAKRRTQRTKYETRNIWLEWQVRGPRAEWRSSRTCGEQGAMVASESLRGRALVRSASAHIVNVALIGRSSQHGATAASTPPTSHNGVHPPSSSSLPRHIT